MFLFFGCVKHFVGQGFSKVDNHQRAKRHKIYDSGRCNHFVKAFPLKIHNFTVEVTL